MLVKQNNQVVIDNKRRETLFCVDTGKVRIGSAYVPPPMTMCDDELEIQKVLMGRQRRPWPKDLPIGILSILAILTVIILAINE